MQVQRLRESQQLTTEQSSIMIVDQAKGLHIPTVDDLAFAGPCPFLELHLCEEIMVHPGPVVYLLVAGWC